MLILSVFKFESWPVSVQKAQITQRVLSALYLQCLQSL